MSATQKKQWGFCHSLEDFEDVNKIHLKQVVQLLLKMERNPNVYCSDFIAREHGLYDQSVRNIFLWVSEEFQVGEKYLDYMSIILCYDLRAKSLVFIISYI